MIRLSFIVLTILTVLAAAPAVLAAPVAQEVREPIPLLWWLGPIGSIIALAYAWYFYKSVMKVSEGTDLMVEIAQAVREGALAGLRHRVCPRHRQSGGVPQ